MANINGIIFEFRAEVKSNINSLREYLNAMNDSVSNLSVCLQENKKQTETELANLQTSLASTQANYTRLLNIKMDSLEECLFEHKEQVAGKLIALQTSLSTQANYTRLLNIKMDSLEECLSEHKEQVTGKLIALQTSQPNHTSQLVKIQGDITYLKIIHEQYTCGGTGGWRRAVYLDMTNPCTTCPSGWQLTGYKKGLMGELLMEPIPVTQQPSLSEEESIPESVERLGPTSMQVQMHLLTITMDQSLPLMVHILTA